MIYVKYTLEGIHPVFGLVHDSNGMLLSIDRTHTLQIYDTSKATMIQSYHLGQDDDHHLYTRSFDISSSLDSIVTTRSNIDALIYRQDGGKWHHYDTLKFRAPVYVSRFSHNGSYLLIGCEDGRTWLYILANKHMMRFIKNEPDSICSTIFSDNDRLIAVSSFSRHVDLFDLHRYMLLNRFETPFVCGELLFTSDNSKLICVGRESGLGWYELSSRKLHTVSFDIHEQITSAVLLGERHVVLATRSNKLYMTEYESGMVRAVIEMPYHGITRLHQDKSTLYIAFVCGNIVAVQIDAYLNELNTHLRINEFEKASELIEENRLLLTQPCIKKFDKFWPAQLNKARNLILDENLSEAIALVKPFFFDNAKREEFESYLKDHQLHQNLITLIEAKKYADAYILIENHPFLENTTEYEKIEEIWNNFFKTCQKMMINSGQSALPEVTSLLKPYMHVKSKVELVRAFLSSSEIFSESEKLLRERNFKRYFEMTQQYPFLSLTDVYDKIIKIGNITLEKLQTYEEKEEWEDAYKTGQLLEDFLPLKQTVEAAIERLKQKKSFIEAIDKDQLQTVYSFAQRYDCLQYTVQFKTYHQRFMDKYEQIQDRLDASSPAKILLEFQSYLSVDYLRSMILYLLKNAYYSQFRAAALMQNRFIDWSASFEKYGLLFGRDEELEQFADRFNLQSFIGQYPHPEFKALNTFPESLIINKKQ